MTTNTIKHRMLKDAKRIAEREYSDRVEKVKNLAPLEIQEYIIPACVLENDDINDILREHPEYDRGEFLKMIKQHRQNNKQARNVV